MEDLGSPAQVAGMENFTLTGKHGGSRTENRPTAFWVPRSLRILRAHKEDRREGSHEDREGMMRVT